MKTHLSLFHFLFTAALLAGCASPPPPTPPPRPEPGWKDPGAIEYVNRDTATYQELAAAVDALISQNALRDAVLKAAVERRRGETGRTPTLRLKVENYCTTRNQEKLDEASRRIVAAFRANNLFAVKDDATADFKLDGELHESLDGARRTYILSLSITERATRTEVWSGTATFAK